MKEIKTKHYKIATYEDFDKWEELEGSHKSYLIEEMFDQGRIDTENPDETFRGLNRKVKRDSNKSIESIINDIMNDRGKNPERDELWKEYMDSIKEYMDENDLIGLTIPDVLLEIENDNKNSTVSLWRRMAKASMLLKAEMFPEESITKDNKIIFNLVTDNVVLDNLRLMIAQVMLNI